MMIEDVKRIVHELEQAQQMSSIGVEMVDNELAVLYMNSKKSEVSVKPGPSGKNFLIAFRFLKGKHYCK